MSSKAFAIKNKVGT